LPRPPSVHRHLESRSRARATRLRRRAEIQADLSATGTPLRCIAVVVFNVVNVIIIIIIANVSLSYLLSSFVASVTPRVTNVPADGAVGWYSRGGGLCFAGYGNSASAGCLDASRGRHVGDPRDAVTPERDARASPKLMTWTFELCSIDVTNFSLVFIVDCVVQMQITFL